MVGSVGESRFVSLLLKQSGMGLGVNAKCLLASVRFESRGVRKRNFLVFKSHGSVLSCVAFILLEARREVFKGTTWYCVE